jgi:peptidoglycan hydrolase CwlO-like protein
MQGLNDDEKRQVLGEVLADELKAIHDLVKDVPNVSRKVNKIEVDVESLKNDMKAVKAVVTEHSHEIKGHGLRITQLEAA